MTVGTHHSTEQVDAIARSRPLHLTPSAMGLVVLGGVFGAAARDALEQALPAARGGFPPATELANLSGAFVLGLLLEALARSGDDGGARRRIRLLLGTGFIGAYTTYSTFAVEADQLGRTGHAGTALAYVIATAAGGLVAVAAGIAAAGKVTGRRRALLPVDPDVDVEAAPRERPRELGGSDGVPPSGGDPAPR